MEESEGGEVRDLGQGTREIETSRQQTKSGPGQKAMDRAAAMDSLMRGGKTPKVWGPKTRQSERLPPGACGYDANLGGAFRVPLSGFANKKIAVKATGGA